MRRPDLRSATVESYSWGEVRWMHSAETGAEKLSVGEMVISPGGQNRQHYHPNCEEVLYVVSGEIDHTFEDSKPVRLKAGMSVLVPMGMPHNSKCVGKIPARMLVAYSSANHQIVEA
jgi:mannose-6-phosphate isomerase-like protein (cupin superfamily)